MPRMKPEGIKRGRDENKKTEAEIEAMAPKKKKVQRPKEVPEVEEALTKVIISLGVDVIERMLKLKPGKDIESRILNKVKKLPQPITKSAIDGLVEQIKAQLIIKEAEKKAVEEATKNVTKEVVNEVVDIADQKNQELALGRCLSKSSQAVKTCARYVIDTIKNHLKIASGIALSTMLFLVAKEVITVNSLSYVP